MLRIEYSELKRAMELLEKESQRGILTIKEEASFIKITSIDNTNKEMSIEISDISYPFKPRVTKMDTF